MSSASSICLSLLLATPPTPTEVPPQSPEEQAKERSNHRLEVTGDVLIGVGMGGFGLMVAGLAVRAEGKRTYDRLILRDDSTPQEFEDAQARQDLGVRLAITGGALATALLASGITLVAVGSRRERLRREALQQKQVSWWGTGPQPWVVATRRRQRAAGLAWAWRF
jgi:hypothetical protein